MKGSWRDRPSGSRFSRLWRPWETLHPFRGKGRSINEPKSVGIRDLVAPPGEVKLRPERRWYVIGGFFFLLFLLLVGRLYVLQVKDYKQSTGEVTSNAIHKASIPAARGLILDRTGQPLVNNVTTVEIRLSRAEATLNPSIEGTLASLTGLKVGQIAQDLANQAYNPYQPAPILANAPATVIQFIKLHPSEFPGVSVLDVSQRSYPLGGNVGSQILGYVGPITKNEIKAHPGAGYQTDSTIGKTGIEAFYEQYLRGHDGTQSIDVDVNGNVIGTLKTTQPRVGDSVVLNIDGGLQKALDGILKSDILHDRTVPDPRSGILPQAINGAAVVLDVNDGAVLAMSSYPSYNLSSFVNGLSDNQFHHLLAVGAFNNYAIQGLYTPGSTFKMISATAELQTGILSPDYTIDDTGSFRVPGCKSNPRGCVFHDDETTGNGDVDLVSALTKSSDYYFYNLGYLFWSQQAKYGQTPIQNVAREYGLDTYTDIDLPDEVEGRVDSPEVRKELHAEAPKGVSERELVHRGQHRDGLRPGHHGADTDRARERLRHVRQRWHALRARSRRRHRQRPRPDHRALRPARPRSRQSAAARARPDPRGPRRRRDEPRGHGVPALQGQHRLLVVDVPDRRQDRHGHQRWNRHRAELVVRRLRTDDASEVRGVVRD